MSPGSGPVVTAGELEAADLLWREVMALPEADQYVLLAHLAMRHPEDTRSGLRRLSGYSIEGRPLPQE
jgi:hypothetical protein